ncbi:T9SS type A sorting domain-containing protein [Marivirga tractuosa]|uniref:T9SS type A sorting domain-containing protein n=1 Tax=Marivirga tractuosa TaxID=1006 RepID=UPI0035CFCEE6
MKRFYFLLTIISISLFPFIGLGQTGPAGVGTGDGSSGPHNVLWLRSDIGISQSAGKVSAWADQSGNNLDASQATPALQADYTGSNANLNGFPSINFGASNGYLTIGDNDLLDDTDGLTALFVLRTPSSIGTEGVLSKRVSNGNEQSYVFFTTGGGFEARFDGDGGVDSENSTISTDANLVVSSIFDGSVQSISNFVNTDNGGVQTGASNTLENRVSDLFLGNFNTGDNRNFEGDIAEVILYRDALNGAERLIVENYLAEKYDLTITNDIFGEYVDFDSNYFNDFRAIGTSNGTEKKSESGFSDAFQIREASGGLDTNLEFFAIGHNDAVAHSEGVTTDLGANITSRWGKDLYLENSQNNVIDNGESDMDLIFDFGDAGFSLGSPSNYVLLYRSANSGNYERVFANSYSVENGDQLVISIPGNRIKSGYYTVGEGDQLISRTWYVLKNGDWTDPNTWTLDAGIAPAPNNPGGDIPADEDNVVIRNGRTVDIQNGTNDIEIASLRVDGKINLNNTTGHNFNVINGKGTIDIKGNGGISNFPLGTTTGSNGFANELNGGLLVVSGAGLEFDQDLTLKDLRIDLTNPSDEAILGADITLNGDFTIRKGTWQFGDNTASAREFTVFGDVLVQDNGSTQEGLITTSTQNVRHSFNLYGDFTNEGDARFSQRTTQTAGSDPGDGITDVYFLSTDRNQTIRANGPTYFLRVIIDKGDPAYSATFTASQPTNFVLTGRANQNIGGDVNVPNDNQNAFGLITGTAVLGTNINVDPLNITGNYSIGTNAKLLIDGGFARKTGGNAITPYGEIEVNAGTLQIESGSGVTSRGSGLLKVNGGIVNIPQFRTSVNGPENVGGLEINGGQVNIGTTNGINPSGDYYTLSLTYPENAFIMTGGELNVSDATGRGLVFINSDPGNVNVSGGTVNFISSNANEAKLTSRAPFYRVTMASTNGTVSNFTLNEGTSGNGGNARTLSGQPLKVLQDLIVRGYNDQFYNNPFGNFPTTFSAVTSSTNVNDVYVGGTFYVGRWSFYDAVFGGVEPYDNIGDQPTEVNTTYFNQTSGTSAIDTVYWGGSGAIRMELGNLVLDRNTGNELRGISRTGGNGAIRFDINGNGEVRSGTLDQNIFTIRIWGNVVNHDRMGTYFASGSYPEAGGTPDIAQIRFREDPPVVIDTEDGAIFGNIRFNVGSATIAELNSDVTIERMEYWNGRIYIKNHTLTINEIWNINNGGGNFFNGEIANNSLIRINNEGIVANVLIFTDGNASDGGLRLKINGNTVPETEESRLNNISPITFPIGFTNDGGSTVYTRPAQMKVKDFSDDGYVRINVVSGELETSDLSGGEILQHYWRVRHDGFTDLPTVAFRFYYRGSGAVVSGIDRPSNYASSDEDNYVPGYVLDGNPYTRVFESDPAEDLTDIITSTYGGNQSANEDNRTRVIHFNGNSTGGEFDQNDFNGFELVGANYTAGVSSRFVGAPTVYYSRMTNNQSWYDRNWEDGTSWSLIPHNNDNNNSARPTAGTWPQEGDIAVLGYGGFTGGISPQHSIEIQNGDNIEVAEIVYENPINNSTRLVVNRNATVSFGKISGTGGTFMQRYRSTDNPTITGDFGEFYTNENFTYNYYLDQNGTYNITPPTDIFPNLRVEGGNNNRIAIFQNDILVNNELRIDGNTTLRTNNGPNGDIEVLEALRIGGYLGGNVEFNDGSARTIEVGRLRFIGSNNTSNLNVRNNTQNGIIHRLIVNDNIEQERPGNFDLFNGFGTNNNAILEFKGEGDHSYIKSDGNTADMYQIVINKGANQSSSFELGQEFDIPDATTTFQPIEILNGTLIMNTPDINGGTGIVLANGSNFMLPNTNNLDASSGSGALELRDGNFLIEGDNTGLILDGLLTISGGTLDMASGAGNGNNFIEYSVSGNAEIDITDGVLEVGSQVRRGLLSTSGVLKYTQSGGTARFGINTAPEQNRGVFEILNSGSEFNHSGGDFILERQNGSATTASLRLEPDSYDFTGSTITIGGIATPVGQNQIGINATVPMNNLLITGNNALNARIFINPLTVNSLEVENNGTFSANGLDLTIVNDLEVNGTFNNQGNGTNQQTTFFNTAGTLSILGTGTIDFWNVDKTGAGTLSLNHEVTVENNLNILNGILSTNANTLNLEGDLIHDGEHQSAVAEPGIVFNGTATQNIARSNTGQSIFGTITIDNSNGVEVTAGQNDFEINHKVILASGVFDIGSNLLIMDEDAIFENGSGGTNVSDFNVNNMITVNTSLIDKGVKKIYPENFSGSFVYPVGLLNYTPAVVNATDVDGNGFITIKPIDNFSDGITDDDDELCAGAVDYDDTENVLQYYWLVKSDNITNFDGSFTMYHNDVLESVNNGAGLDLTNYAPARLLNADDTWDKIYSEQLFDEVGNTITFQSDLTNDYNGLNSGSIEGRYTAGITRDNSDALLCGSAIPNVVPLFETLTGIADGNVNVGGSFVGGVAPSVGQSPDLVVRGNYTLILNDNFRRFRKVIIEENATLEVNSTFGHNLGTIEGTGTLKLVDDGAFPAGDYEDFFPDANCSNGGGLEYENNDLGTDVTILAEGFTNLKRLILSGNGKKVMSNATSVNICENLELAGGDFEMANNSELRVKGNIIKNGGSNFNAEFTNATIVMDGTTNQTISGQFTGLEAFNILEVNKSSGRLSIIDGGNNDVEVSGELKFTNGLINTNTDNSLVIQNSATLSGFKTSSHVNGPLIRNLNASTASDFDPFPVGQSGRYGLIEVSYIQNTDDWTATFFSESPEENPAIGTLANDLGGSNPVVSANQYWELTSAGSNMANVKISWDPSSNIADGSASVAQSLSELRVVRFKDGVSSQWEDQGQSSVSGNASNGELTSNNRFDFSTNFVTFGAGDANNNSLPVELTFFTAENNGNRVDLKWQTASEKNNDFFEIQRSFDGTEFEVLGIVEGAGDSKETIDYDFKDYAPLAGDSYYRLRQVDYDGAFEYSEVVKVIRVEASNLVAVPNPTQAQNIHLRLSGFHGEQKVQVAIFDMQGRRHYQAIHNPSDFNRALPINQELNSGIYIVDVKQGNIRKKVRLMVK